MIFDAFDWHSLATLFDGVGPNFGDRARPYAGYKPHVAEAPNGDTKLCVECFVHGRSWACTACHGAGRVPNIAPPTTRYLHVAPKYNPPPWATAYLARAHYEACRVAEALGVSAAYYPRVADGTLRVLDYDVGGSQPEHTDFDLFTIVCYRSTPADLETYESHAIPVDAPFFRAREFSPGLHIGELGELVGLGPATPHRVPARPYKQQSIVYFAMPDHAAILRAHSCDACGGDGKRFSDSSLYDEADCRKCNGTGGAPQTVGEWLDKRKAASRVYK